MAYEEKKNGNNEEEFDFTFIMKFVHSLLKKWWLIILLAIAFTLGGFGVAKLTYNERYTSGIILSINNKNKDIAGTASTYSTSSDIQASASLATNMKLLVQHSNDFMTRVKNAAAALGTQATITELRNMISVEQYADSTLLSITVTAATPEDAENISRAIESVYPAYVEITFPTATFVTADPTTDAKLARDSSTMIYSFVGLLIGLTLSVGIVLMSMRMENKVGSTMDIKNNFNINILATVGKIKKKKNERVRLLISDKNVGLPFIETFKLIRTKLENVKIKNGYSVFAVTSSTESEGKTTISTNIALSLAKIGKSVLLIDADLRKPAVAKLLGLALENERGLYDIVEGRKSFEEAVKYVEKYNLYLLISQEAVPDPSETLASSRMNEIIKEAKKSFDYVIVDCPPAGVVADAAIVANYTDTIIFVTCEGKAAIPQVEFALSDLMTTKADILGCIYNSADIKPLFVKASKGYGGYGGYGYGYGYGYYSSYYGRSSYYYGSSSSGKHSSSHHSSSSGSHSSQASRSSRSSSSRK